jgi:hypothetical protein
LAPLSWSVSACAGAVHAALGTVSPTMTLTNRLRVKAFGGRADGQLTKSDPTTRHKTDALIIGISQLFVRSWVYQKRYRIAIPMMRAKAT